jgi:hypothetical protein
LAFGVTLALEAAFAAGLPIAFFFATLAFAFGARLVAALAFGLFAAARFFAAGLRTFLEVGADLVDLLVPVFRAIGEGTGSKESAFGE